MSDANKKPQPEAKKQQKTWNMPDTYVIIFFVVMLAALLTYAVPVGSFEMTEVKYEMNGAEKTKSVPLAGSFQLAKDDNGLEIRKGVKFFEPFGEVGFSNYIFEGLVSGDKWGSAVGVVAFILVIGGAFGIVMRTGAVEAGLLQMIQKTQGREWLLIPVLFFVFSLGGAVFGMGEEALAFAMILVPIIVGLGYDSITAIFITYVATQIGFGTSWMNPFSVAIAQGVSELPVLSGAKFRMVMWFVFTLLGAVYTIWYARKVKKNPESSIAYESDAYFRNDMQEKKDSHVKFGTGHILVLMTLLLGIIWVVWGVVKDAYYLPEIATQFIIMGIVSGIIGVVFKLGNMTINDIAVSFRDGAKDLLGAALVVGMAKGIVLVLGGSDPATPTVLNTILNSMAGSMSTLPPMMCAWIMYVFQSVFNFFVVSGSGQAALTMPIMAPLSDLVGVSRQVSVLAFQLGDGFTNLIVPTSGVLMGMLGIARLDWTKWAKHQIKFQAILFTTASLFIFAAVMIGYS